jgi:transcriptional regulator with XRE-family HTH domain
MVDAGVDQSELARAIGVTQGTISLILLGKTRQSKYLPEIAIELGVAYDWLMGRDVHKHADRPVDLLVTSTERDLIERIRALSPPNRFALERVNDGFLHAHAGGGNLLSLLPNERALARMFAGLLRSIDPQASLDEQAQLLAKRLPIGLTQLQAPLIEREDEAPVGRAAAAPDPAMQHPELQPARHT